MRAPFLQKSNRRNKTGVVGISVLRQRGHDSRRVHTYFSVSRGVGRYRKFNVDTLGKEEAWRRALRCRAEFERSHLSHPLAIPH